MLVQPTFFMRDANAKVGKPNIPRVSTQKDAIIMQKFEMKIQEMQTCNYFEINMR